MKVCIHQFQPIQGSLSCHVLKWSFSAADGISKTEHIPLENIFTFVMWHHFEKLYCQLQELFRKLFIKIIKCLTAVVSKVWSVNNFCFMDWFETQVTCCNFLNHQCTKNTYIYCNQMIVWYYSYIHNKDTKQDVRLI